MGTNNVDFCARLCHAATVAGLSRTIGVGAPNTFFIGFNRNRSDFVVGNQFGKQPACFCQIPSSSKKQVLEWFLSTLSMKKVSTIIGSPPFPNRPFWIQTRR